jgi:endonuclease YncB( thermonuclease family)
VFIRRLALHLAKIVVTLIVMMIASNLFLLRNVSASPLYQELPAPLTDYAPISITLTDSQSSLQLTRVDFWPATIVFLGIWTPGPSSTCIYRNNFSLQIGGNQYKAISRDSIDDQRYPGIDAPGLWPFGICGSNEPRVIAIPFGALLSNEPASIQFHQAAAALPAGLLGMRETSNSPDPTATPTVTPNPTPTTTPISGLASTTVSQQATAPDQFTLPFSSAARSVVIVGEVATNGVRFHLERIDFWEELPGDKAPTNALFMVLTGYLLPNEPIVDGSCVGGKDVYLQIGRNRYDLSAMREAKQFYEVDFPGYFLSQCVDESQREPTFMVFDVPSIAEPIELSFHDKLLPLGDSLQELQAASVQPILGTLAQVQPMVATQVAQAEVSPTSEPTSAIIEPASEPTSASIEPSSEQPTSTATPTASSEATTAIEQQEPVTDTNTFRAAVINIVSGDTIDVLIDGQQRRVRYQFIDAPDEGEPFHAEANRANTDMVAWEVVDIVADGPITDSAQTEQTDLILGNVYLDDGTYVNSELVRQGFAVADLSATDPDKLDEIFAAQAEAITSKRGIWSLMAETTETSEEAAITPNPTDAIAIRQTPLPEATSTPNATASAPTASATTEPVETAPVEIAAATQTPVATGAMAAEATEAPTVQATATAATNATPPAADAPTLTPMPAETIPAASSSAATLSGVPVQVRRNANLRSGPGTQYSIIGRARAGETLTAVGKNEDSSWLTLDTNAWIAAFLVTGPVEELAVVPVEPKPTVQGATGDLEPDASPTTTGDIDLSAVQEHAAEVLVYINTYIGALDNLESLSSNVEATPALMSDENWRAEVLVNFASILSTNHLIREMSPPADLADIHNNLLEMTKSYEKAMTYFTIGIESADANLVTSGIAELEAGKAVMNTAVTILTGLIE